MRAKAKQVLITHTDAAVMAGVDTHKLLRWARNGSDGFPAPVKRVMRTTFFNRREIEEWFRLRGAAAGGRSPN